MAVRQLPDAALLRKLLRYDPETGKLYWLPRTPDMFAEPKRYSRETACKTWNTKNADKEAFPVTMKGYKMGGLLGEAHLAHRVAWAIYTGTSDFDHIDHINGDRSDNRIVNLRCIGHLGNMKNVRQRHDCQSGETGVHLHINKRWGRPRWVARIQVTRRRITVGYFDTKEEAIEARRLASIRYGFGPNHGAKR